MSRWKLILPSVVFHFLSLPSAAAVVSCASVFAKLQMTPEIQVSIDKTITALAELKLNLDLSQAEGSRDIKRTVLAADYISKEKQLLSYLETHDLMTKTELLENIKIKITILQEKQDIQIREAKEEAVTTQKQIAELNERITTRLKARLHRIEPGVFKMTTAGQVRDFKIERPFEMLATSTTQIIWRTVVLLAEQMGASRDLKENPSIYKGDDRPVEYVSLADTLNWLEALNQLSRQDNVFLEQLIEGHKTGDQYRLPKPQERLFVLHGRGQFSGTYHFGSDAKELNKYAWYAENSNGKPQPVARLAPLIIDGMRFYDMHGNVEEWVSGWENSNGLVMGGSAKDLASDLEIRSPRAINPTTRETTIGFRFVREVRR